LLFAEDDIRVKTAILLLLYSGVRRGELCGLEWRDIDFDRQMIHINRASQYQQGKGIAEVPTKNLSSERSIKLPAVMFTVLTEYRAWWAAQKLAMGDAWVGDKDRLFTQCGGKPINPDTINYWLGQFIEKHSLPHFTPHSCRHTFSSLQIANGVDVRTLQARTGHAQASTLVNIYSHAIKTAVEAASDILDDVLTPDALTPKETARAGEGAGQFFTRHLNET
jgi:integrase